MTFSILRKEKPSGENPNSTSHGPSLALHKEVSFSPNRSQALPGCHPPPGPPLPGQGLPPPSCFSPGGATPTSIQTTVVTNSPLPTFPFNHCPHFPTSLHNQASGRPLSHNSQNSGVWGSTSTLLNSTLLTSWWHLMAPSFLPEMPPPPPPQGFPAPLQPLLVFLLSPPSSAAAPPQDL